MQNPPSPSALRQHHWDGVYAQSTERDHSWYQAEPSISLELLSSLEVQTHNAIIDVGGGESFLVDRLVTRGFSDVTVLDIVQSALANSRARVGPDRGAEWIAHDLLTWQPRRRYDVWHDRAVLHFLSGEQVEHYRTLLGRTLSFDGAVVLATFAPDGPECCSGLPVTRYSAAQLGGLLGDEFDVVESRNERHLTPSDDTQSFTWIAARRRPTSSN